MAPLGIALRAMLAAAGISPGGGVVATDDFTDDDATALTDHSAKWTLLNGNFQIASNAVRSVTININNGAGWNADPFDDDQYSQGTIASIQHNYWVGLSVRGDVTTPSANFYSWYGTDDYSALYKVVGGSETYLGEDGPGFSVSDLIRLEAEGTTLRGLINGVPVISVVDATFASGAPGLSAWHWGGDSLLDNWEGGNLDI